MSRHRATWTCPVDEQLIERLRDEGGLTPYTCDEVFDIATANYPSNRLSKFAEYGLVERLGRGLYQLTDDGQAFLDGELDPSTLDPVTDPE